MYFVIQNGNIYNIFVIAWNGKVFKLVITAEIPKIVFHYTWANLERVIAHLCKSYGIGNWASTHRDKSFPCAVLGDYRITKIVMEGMDIGSKHNRARLSHIATLLK